jgi:prolyl-tRNA editing enzyme YbaK/EbsC (Cys-tRNA(Pro) deacylase)
MKDAISIHHLLLERQMVHEIVRLPRGISSTDELPEVLGLPPYRCLCTRLYQRAEYLLAAVIMSAGTWPSEEVVAEVLNVAAVVPAGADLVSATTGYAADLVAPLMLPEDLMVLVEPGVAAADEIVYTATGGPCTALGIGTRDLFSLCAAEPLPTACPLRHVPGNRREQ